MFSLNKRLTRILSAGLALATIVLLYESNILPEAQLLFRPTEDACKTFPKDQLLSLIHPVLKLGHGENRERIKTSIETVAGCFADDELLIVSDLDETIGSRRIIDILADLPSEYFNTSNHRDMENYVRQKQLQRTGEATNDINGWILDKYKFLPMILRAWKEKPGKPFYFFFETDTYVFWTNALRFLKTLDADKPIYIGSPSPGQTDREKDELTWFANGGPGFVLSRGAVKALLSRGNDDLLERWMPLLEGECCGDSVLGWALWNISIPLEGYWPHFNPHPLHGVPFGDNHWSQPPITLHKTTVSDTKRLWSWEAKLRKYRQKVILYSDLSTINPIEPAIRVNWDAGEFYAFRPPPEIEVDTVEACQGYCEAEESCLQWLWRGKDEKQCVLSRAFRLGGPREPERLPEAEERDEEGNVIPPAPDRKERWVDFTSGWVEENIARWKRRQPRVVEWVEPSITRIF